MGYYIETTNPTNKARTLLETLGAQAKQVPLCTKGTSTHIPVVVVQNGPFDAAGIAYDENELNAFTEPSDRRPKTQLLVERAAVIALCPQVESRLNW